MDARLSDRDAVGVLRAVHCPKPAARVRFLTRTIRISNIQIAAPSAGVQSRELIAEGRSNRGKIRGNRNLRDKEN